MSSPAALDIQHLAQAAGKPNPLAVAVVGIGLIGGSLALAWKQAGWTSRILGVDRDSGHADTALRLGLVDEIVSLRQAIAEADLIVLSVPVSALTALLAEVLDGIRDTQIVIDVGSTKHRVLQSVKDHRMRPRLVATHPMAGTEYSGPEAARGDLFSGKATVLCDVEQSDADAVETIERMYRALEMRLVYMDSRAHDVHTAYVSHISHISSFALALTTLEKEQQEEAIFQLASGGFESTVRLAKSNPDMWVPIFEQNRSNVLDVLDELIHQLTHMKQLLVQEDYPGFHALIRKANDIRRILK